MGPDSQSQRAASGSNIQLESSRFHGVHSIDKCFVWSLRCLIKSRESSNRVTESSREKIAEKIAEKISEKIDETIAEKTRSIGSVENDQEELHTVYYEILYARRSIRCFDFKHECNAEDQEIHMRACLHRNQRIFG